LSLPHPSSLAAIKPANPGSPGVIAVKMERDNTTAYPHSLQPIIDKTVPNATQICKTEANVELNRLCILLVPSFLKKLKFRLSNMLTAVKKQLKHYHQ